VRPDGTKAALGLWIEQTEGAKFWLRVVRAARRGERSRGHFPNDEAATKLLFLVFREVSREWKMLPPEWAAAKTQFAVMFDEQFSVD
jgi:transposase-like protein